MMRLITLPSDADPKWDCWSLLGRVSILLGVNKLLAASYYFERLLQIWKCNEDNEDNVQFPSFRYRISHWRVNFVVINYAMGAKERNSRSAFTSWSERNLWLYHSANMHIKWKQRIYISYLRNLNQETRFHLAQIFWFGILTTFMESSKFAKHPAIRIFISLGSCEVASIFSCGLWRKSFMHKPTSVRGH